MRNSKDDRVRGTASQALRNLLIDKCVNKIYVKEWHQAHAYKSPDLTPAKRKDARQQLQDKGLVVIDGSMVWINRETEANMEPYLNSEDEIPAQNVGGVGYPL